MVYELYYSKLNLNKWLIIAEKYSRGGMGSKVNDIILKLNNFLEKEILNSNKSIDYQRFDYKNFENYVRSFFSDSDVVSSGTQRIIFYIDEDHVLKIPKYSTGADAIKRESNMRVQGLMSGMLPRVYASDPNGFWMISERVIPLYHDDEMEEWFSKLIKKKVDPSNKFNYQAFDAILYAMWKGVESGKSAGDAIYDYLESLNNEEFMEKVLHSPTIIKLIRLVDEEGSDYRRLLNDLIPMNAGYNSEGDPVILDWG